MKALSILQPYAWLIVHGHKDIENRSWPTAFRGRFLVHAGKTYHRRLHNVWITDLLALGIVLPCFEEMPLGAIVGEADLVDCVRYHPSMWKDAASWGFVLANAEPCAPRPYRGQLGFFEVRESTSETAPTLL